VNKRITNIFFIVGAQRGGTTYLYKVLDDHPEIYMAKPLKPEPKFFLSQDYHNNLGSYENKYFGNTPAGTKVFGEKSTSYYENASVAQRIKTAYPKSKIIIILRNPIDRAISNYYFSLKNGLEIRTLEETFLIEKPPPEYPKEISANPFNYLGRSEYLIFLKNYLKYFSREQMKILIFELFMDDENQIGQLYDYLGVDETFKPKFLNHKVNPLDYPPLDKNKSIYLKLKSYFSDPINQLEDFLSLDLTIWKT
jgi:hypothetical protein